MWSFLEQFWFSFSKPRLEMLADDSITLGQLDRAMKIYSLEEEVLKISCSKAVQLLFWFFFFFLN